MASINSSIREYTGAGYLPKFNIVQDVAKRPTVDVSPVTFKSSNKVQSNIVKLKPRSIRVAKPQDILK